MGIHTGLLVVGEMGGGDKHEQLALGETPNVAARIPGLAEPDTVAISATTQPLIQGYFVCQALGPHTLKGVATPVNVYRVLGESGAQSRLEIASSRGLTPLVGRESEIVLLLARSAEHYVEAEACFRQALEVSRRQQARSLEFRASRSLSQLWQRQGKRAEAHDLLAPIYGWFTEGFDTEDLQEAKALLQELS
jgi:Adenylate and Guanylate cyclase catalytic domain